MIKRCNGRDGSVVKVLEDNSCVPCDCGLVFNDNNHFVTYPHKLIWRNDEEGYFCDCAACQRSGILYP